LAYRNLDLKEDAVSFINKDNKLYIVKNCAKWLFREIDKLKLIEADLDKKARYGFVLCFMDVYGISQLILLT